jgi:hypothetical protein
MSDIDYSEFSVHELETAIEVYDADWHTIMKHTTRSRKCEACGEELGNKRTLLASHYVYERSRAVEELAQRHADQVLFDTRPIFEEIPITGSTWTPSMGEHFSSPLPWYESYSRLTAPVKGDEVDDD